MTNPSDPNFEHPPEHPVEMVRTWLAHAADHSGLPNPNAMILATSNAAGKPSGRVVLQKGFDQRGVVFFTNRQSQKGRELAENPLAAVVFHWDSLERQLRIEGKVTEVDEEESDAYFNSRPRGSRLGAWASRQSTPIEHRRELDQRQAELERTYEGKDVPRPPHWGGYRISLDRVEFWEGRPSRLHDRLVYVANAGDWTIQRLQP